MKNNWELKKLGKVCDVAVQEKLVSCVPNDETASALLKKINIEERNSIKKSDKFSQKEENKIYYKLPTGWKTFKAEEICQFSTGKLNSNQSVPEGKYPFFTCSQETYKIDTYSFDCEALLLSGNNAQGVYSVKYYKGKFDAYQRTYIITTNEDLVDYMYLKYLLETKLEELKKNSLGTLTKYLTLSILLNLILPIPPLAEQQHIVSILDETFAAIDKAKENAKKNLQNARELFESYLQSVFANPEKGWEICKLEDYVKFIDYRGKTPTKTSTGLRLITAKNVKNGFLEKAPEEFVNPVIYDTWMTRGIPKIGDVLFTTEAPLANVAQLDTNEKVAFAQRIIILQPQANKINQTFLKYLLLSKPLKQEILAKGTGATVQGIKSSLLKKIKIYFPKSLSEQQRIVAKLDALSAETKKLEAIYQQKLAALDELKKSVLQKAFNGELAGA